MQRRKSRREEERAERKRRASSVFVASDSLPLLPPPVPVPVPVVRSEEGERSSGRTGEVVQMTERRATEPVLVPGSDRSVESKLNGSELGEIVEER